jgi:hypothetical protein
MARRIDLIVTHGPDFYRQIRRDPAQRGASTNGLQIDADDQGAFGSFNLSLSGVSRALARNAGSAVAVPTADLPTTNNGLDIWAEGEFAFYSSDNLSEEGNFFIGHAGLDIPIAHWARAGLMGELDWTEQRLDAFDSHFEGTGWMLGPYVATEPMRDVFIDVRALWGQSSNSGSADVNANRFEGDFDTQRWLVEAIGSTKFQHGGLTWAPEGGVIYMRETQSDYSVNDGQSSIDVQGQSAELGRLTLGARISSEIKLDMQSLHFFVEPRLFWDFINEGDIALDGYAYSTDEFRGAITGGLLVNSQGYQLGIESTYDGIGAEGYESISIKVMLNFQF